MRKNFLLVSVFLLLSFVGGVKAQEVVLETGPQYVTLARCYFIVFGQFDYQQAKTACQTRRAVLAYFTTASEEHTVRRNIEWSLMPGFPIGPIWVGQLWIGAKRSFSSPTGWAWDNPIMPDAPVMLSPWANRADIGGDCIIARQDGWAPFNCSAYLYGVRYPGGALCSSARRFPPEDPVTASSANYCGTFLLPPSRSNVALPTVMKKSYFLIKGRLTFDEATKICGQNGREMATSRSAEEHAFIAANVDFSLVGYRVWLGLKRVSSGSDQFVWIDAMANSYTEPFLQGQPELYGGDCISYDQGADGRIGWRASVCTEKMSALCEEFEML